MHKLIVALAIVLNVGIFSASHWYFSNNPRTTMVIVDSSFPMSKKWSLVNQSIQFISDKHRYDQLYLATDKADIGVIDPPKIKLQIPYGIRDLKQVADKYERSNSWRYYMVTNADQIPEPYEKVLVQ